MKKQFLFELIVILLLSVTFSEKSIADNSAIGTWEGTWYNEGYGGGISLTLNSNGTLTGAFEQPLEPYGSSGTAIVPLSGTYTYNSINGWLTFDCEGSIFILGYNTVFYQDGSGFGNCDSASGDYWLTSYYYDSGYWWLLDDNDHGTWNINRVSVPLKTTNLGPVNGATNQSTTTDLSWLNGGGACTFDVYFGTDSTPDSSEFKGNQFGTTFDTGTLAYETTYYWRIDAMNTNGITTGNVWSFTTGVNPNQLPVISSLTATSPIILDIRTSQLQVIASDPDSGPSPISYNWILQGGQGSVDDPTSDAPIYTPPDISSSQQIFTITVEVSDGDGVTSSTVDITVVDVELIVCDFYKDGYVDFADYAILASHWFDTDCEEPDWCEGADVDYSGTVDFFDFDIFAKNWLSDIAPLGHWRLDDNQADTTVTDSSGNGKDGTAQQNTAALTTAGKVGTALTFNGSSDYISIPDSSDWTFDGDFTICLWVKFDAFNSNWWESAFAAHDEGGGETNKWILSYDPASESTLFHVNIPNTNNLIVQSNSWGAQVGAWYFIAMTRSGNTYTFYRDGVANGSQSNTVSIPDAAAALTIGWAEGGSKFDGAIDDVRVYDRALSVGEIAGLYNE